MLTINEEGKYANYNGKGKYADLQRRNEIC